MQDRGQKIHTRHDALGRGILFTTLDSLTTMRNEVKRDFDGLGNLVTVWQERNGAVSSGSQKFQYVYNTDFANNRTSLTKTAYPDGRKVGTVFRLCDRRAQARGDAQSHAGQASPASAPPPAGGRKRKKGLIIT